ncbi:unnamed protein product [Tilletia controversa]|nr:unnamed protein product [Tilletia controversa]CAD6915939.1 unnamed protein product [Tilletia controversa]CAD6924746.1 unnamed protein product [Tilletia controversa]CAD6954292.1 unnamed protein product [Tilletia controversa]
MAFGGPVGFMASEPSSGVLQARGTHTLFFYGTLVHPAILARVIGNQGAHLRVRNALLPAHATWHVQRVDYPALVSLSDRRPQQQQQQPDAPTSASLTAGDDAETVVPGTLISGLTDSDLRFLDLFEGDQYVRKEVSVQPVEEGDGISNALRPRDASLADILADLDPTANELLKSKLKLETVRAQTYVWCAPLSMLEDRRWIFAEFAREKAKRWIGAQADHEYTDVDRTRSGTA